MTPADFIIQPGIDPDVSIATDRYLMRVVGRRSRPRNAVLRVYSFPGDVISLGRFHLAPPIPQSGGGMIYRRHSGGRVLPCGDGFVGVSLILPHRSALFGEDPFLLAPYQVLNRYVRGLLEACRLVGLPVHYPGRDFVTVDRRVLAAVSFETDEHGVMLFEALVGNTRDFTVLPRFLDRADPEGVVRVQLIDQNSTTSLSRELQTQLAIEEVADLLHRGFAKQFALDFALNEPSPLERQVIEGVVTRECAPAAWLMQRRPRPDLDRHASIWAQLGVFDVYLSLQQRDYIKDILFAGDFIANSPGIELLERKLRLCPLDARAVEGVITEVFSGREHFVLGVGKLRTITDAILRAGE
jgi:lipoate-protein ligase A